MDKYELVVVIDSNLSQEEKDSTIKEVADLVSKEGGKVINSQVWLDKHKFTFAMKKRSHGTYYLLNFEGKGPKNNELRQGLKLNDKVLRSLLVKTET